MLFDYAGMQRTATRLMGRFAQGTVVLTRTTQAASDPATPWLPGPATETSYTLAATVRRVEQRYVDGTLIEATDDQIMFAVPEIEPKMSDKFSIDGRVRRLKALRPIPAAGTPVAYIAFVGS